MDEIESTPETKKRTLTAIKIKTKGLKFTREEANERYSTFVKKRKKKP